MGGGGENRTKFKCGDTDAKKGGSVSDSDI